MSKTGDIVMQVIAEMTKIGIEKIQDTSTLGSLKIRKTFISDIKLSLELEFDIDSLKDINLNTTIQEIVKNINLIKAGRDDEDLVSS